MVIGIMLFFRVQRRNNFIPGTHVGKNKTDKTHPKHIKFSFIPKGKFSNHALMLKFSNI